ncbi:MAG: hypothetical protein MUE34_00770 [Acidimicrobiales bacterium]|nr:hypothetical protein [Acidimicrobiales bacterium]
MLLAELEIHHSRPIAPTRRVALGLRDLPFDPPPGYGAVLLGGIVARFAGDLDPELFDELEHLMRQLEAGRRITQPRLRHRFQVDRVGLLRSRHLLVRDDDGVVRFDLETDKGSPAQYVLGAVYAAGEAPIGVRSAVMDAVRRGLSWRGPIDVGLAAHLIAGGKVGRIASGDPIGWALDVLGFAHEQGRPPRDEVLARYRVLLRDAHPDHGGETADAADRIADLTTARRILLERV